ncbi:MAG: CBS domain-containing protein [Methanomicrobiales archaeon]|nr:CBS domain-containing protein [Methanomicrobiales archaeon]
MNGSLAIGKIFGIPVKLHITFLLAIPLFAWLIGRDVELTARVIEGFFNLASGIFGFLPTISIDTSLLGAEFIPYLVGVGVALGLFFGVFIHELAHSLLALRHGIRIHSITLLILGGVSSIEDDLPEPRHELPMALAGPLTSLALGILFGLMVYLVNATAISPPLAGASIFVLGYLGILNVMLFAFNLIPAFPMDGGRVLRAWLATRMPLARATKIAADIGKAFAVLMGLFGVLLVFNPILIIIAFFIYIGADQESMMVRYNVLLKDLRVSDVMAREVITVSPTTPVPELIRMMYATKHLAFPVVDQGVLTGMVTLDDVHRTPEIDRDARQVRDIMTRTLVTLPPDALLTAAFRLMTQQGIGRIPIVEGSILAGIVTRTDILRVMELREI